jgi:hypothetical protein
MNGVGAVTRSEAEVNAVLEEFEHRHKLFGLTVERISLWRILRFEISLTMQNLGLTRPLASKREILTSIFSAAWQFIVAPRGFRYLGATMSSALRRFDERGWHDIYFDPVMDAIAGGEKMLYIDARGFEEHSKRAHRRPVFNDTSVVALSAVLGRLFPVRGYDDVFQALSKAVFDGLALSEFTADRIRRKYSVLIWRIRLYRLVLWRLRPGCVLIPNSGQFALFLAARALGIPFVEMQHGIFSENHPDSLPASVLNFDQSSMLLPDLLTVYGSWWGDRLRNTALGRLGRIREVGAFSIDTARAMRLRQFSSDGREPVVTLTSQGTGVERLADFLAEFLNLYPGPLRLNIRLHPSYEAGARHYDGRFSNDDRVKLWAGNSKPDTFEMIAMSDLHLSVSSACHYEALGIGTPTGVLALPGHELVLELVERQHAVLVDSPATLAAIVTHRSWTPVSEGVSDQFFRRGHVDNMWTLLAECGHDDIG